MSVSEPGATGSAGVAMSESWTDSYPAYGARLRRRPRPAGDRQPGALVRPDAPAGPRRRAERARLDADLQGRHRRRQRADRWRRLLPTRPRVDLRRDRRPLRPWRAGRPGHRLGRAAPPGRAAEGRRGAVPPHAVGQRPDRRQRRLLRHDRAGEGDPAQAGRRRHQDRADGVRRGGRRRPDGGRGPAGDLRDRREAAAGGLRAAVRDHGGHPRRDRGDLQQRRHHRRRPDRVRRPRRAGQRLLRRADDHRGRAPRGRQVDAGPGLLPRRPRSTTT